MNNSKTTYGLFAQPQNTISAEQVKALWDEGFEAFINSSQAQPQYKPRPPTARDLEKRTTSFTYGGKPITQELLDALVTAGLPEQLAAKLIGVTLFGNGIAGVSALDQNNELVVLQLFLGSFVKAQQEDFTVTYDRAMKVVG